MRMFCSLLVALSLADTLTMPFASMSNVTSTCGTPRSAGGMPTRSNWPSNLLSAGHFPFPLEDADRYRILIVLGGGECLALLGRNRRVPIDQAREHPAERFDAQRQRGHVEQQHILDVALENAGLNGGADGDHLVRIDAPMRFPSEEVLHRLDYLGHTGHAATRITSPISPAERPASLSAARHGSTVRSTRSSTSASSLARVSLMFRCLGPFWSAVMNGRFTSV